MTTSREHLEKFSREDLIGTIQGLEASLAEAAGGLMAEGSRQELEKWKKQAVEWERIAFMSADTFAARIERNALRNAKIPRLIRWWYGC